MLSIKEIVQNSIEATEEESSFAIANKIIESDLSLNAKVECCYRLEKIIELVKKSILNEWKNDPIKKEEINKELTFFKIIERHTKQINNNDLLIQSLANLDETQYNQCFESKLKSVSELTKILGEDHLADFIEIKKTQPYFTRVK